MNGLYPSVETWLIQCPNDTFQPFLSWRQRDLSIFVALKSGQSFPLMTESCSAHEKEAFAHFPVFLAICLGGWPNFEGQK